MFLLAFTVTSLMLSGGVEPIVSDDVYNYYPSKDGFAVYRTFKDSDERDSSYNNNGVNSPCIGSQDLVKVATLLPDGKLMGAGYCNSSVIIAVWQEDGRLFKVHDTGERKGVPFMLRYDGDPKYTVVTFLYKDPKTNANYTSQTVYDLGI